MGQQMPKPDISQIAKHKCVGCGSTVFLPAHELKPVSPLISQSGQEEIIRLHIFICMQCYKKVEKEDLFPSAREVPSEH